MSAFRRCLKTSIAHLGKNGRQFNLSKTAVRHCSAAEVGEAESRYTPRRACLYVPGNDEKKLSKIPTVGSDCVIMDCEDGVALNRKEEARNTIKKTLDELNFGQTEPIVRVNSVSSGLAEDDLDVTLSAQRLPPTIMLPKVEQATDIDWFAEKLYSALKARKDKESASHPINLITYVENAVGLLNLREVCRRAEELAETGIFVLDGIVFGSDDFCADIGATRTTGAREVMYARQHVLLVAKSYRLQAIDMVHIDFKDLEGLKEQSLEGARMGYTGKQVIHPIQVPVVQEAFTPSSARMEWATELVKAFEEHQQSGQGAFTFRGNMIDMPLLLQAKNILQLMRGIRGAGDTSGKERTPAAEPGDQNTEQNT